MMLQKIVEFYDDFKSILKSYMSRSLIEYFIDLRKFLIISYIVKI